MKDSLLLYEELAQLVVAALVLLFVILATIVFVETGVRDDCEDFGKTRLRGGVVNCTLEVKP